MKIRTEVKIGFIVLVTILMVIYGINYLKGKNVLKRSDVYYAVYDDVMGLLVSDAVFINGLKVGLINDIDFNRNNYNQIVVALAVDKKIKIPANSVAELFSSDLLGNKALRIIPSNEKMLAHYGDTLLSSKQLDLFSSLQTELSPFKEKAENTISKLDSLLSSFNNIFDSSSSKNLSLLIENLEKSTNSLKNQVGPGGKIDQTLDNLAVFSKVLNDNKEKFNALFSNIEEITDSIAQSNLKNALFYMGKTLEQTQKLLSGINEGEGSLGLLATSESLYRNIESATANLSSLLEDLEKNPKRYVHFSLFGKKDKP